MDYSLCGEGSRYRLGRSEACWSSEHTAYSRPDTSPPCMDRTSQVRSRTNRLQVSYSCLENGNANIQSIVQAIPPREFIAILDRFVKSGFNLNFRLTIEAGQQAQAMVVSDSVARIRIDQVWQGPCS